MYLPPHFAVNDADLVRALIDRARFGHLVTMTADGLDATPLPFVIDDDLTTVRAHIARANPQWRTADGADALLVVPVSDTYVSPRWYPSKAEHGRVVPTWNYEVLHLRGTLTVDHDADTLESIVRALTDREEALLGDPTWSVDDAPADFVAKQLGAIVGITLQVTAIDAKRKLSQNRSDGDRDGVVDGLRSTGRPADHEVAEAMRVACEDA